MSSRESRLKKARSLGRDPFGEVEQHIQESLIRSREDIPVMGELSQEKVSVEEEHVRGELQQDVSVAQGALLVEETPASLEVVSFNSTACPYLGGLDGRDISIYVPQTAHRCYAEGKALPVAIAQQELYCLSSAYAECAAYSPPPADPARGEAKETEKGRHDRRGRPVHSLWGKGRMGNMRLWVHLLIAIVIWFVAGLFARLAGFSGNPAMIGVLGALLYLIIVIVLRRRSRA